MPWEIQREEKCNEMRYMRYMRFILSKTGLKYLDQFFKLLKKFRKIYRVKILLLPDILLLYYL